MNKIEKVWFENNRIYIHTTEGKDLSRPLEAFPLLLAATDEQRNKFVIGRFGDDLRWPELDEDIHINSFSEEKEPNTDNVVANILSQLPWIKIDEVAKEMDIHPSVLTLYYYGMSQPSQERLNSLRNVLHGMGERLIAV